MANEILKRDQNSVPVLAGITDDANQEIRMVRVDPATNRVLVSATGIGVNVETPTGTVNGSNVTFTVVNTPVAVIIDGITKFSGFGYTYAAGTITVDSDGPPVQYIRTFY